MAQAPKLSLEQWWDVRDAWEQDPRDGYTWLVKELDLPVSAPGVRKTALKQGWVKRKPSSKKPSKPSGVEFVKAPGSKGSGSAKAKRGGGPKPVSETIETICETIETMPETSEGDEELDDSAEGTSEHINNPRRTRARTKIGEAPEGDPIMGELLAYDQSGLDDLFEPDIDTPGLYRHQYARIAYKFFLLGATVDGLADLLGVHKDTIYQWARKHPEFNTAMRGGRDFADANVASRLYARAMGYSHAEEVIKVVDDKIVRVNTVKHYAPDPGAAIFWLKNRQPELWKEKVEIVEKPSIALVDKDAMEAIYRNALDHAATVQASMVDRGARLGLTIDNELDDD